MVVVANLVNAFAASVYLMLLVERAKKCLDFAATIYSLHLLASFLYSGVSHTVAWWAVNVTGLIITAILGEWLCLQREMRDIEVGSRGRRRQSAEMVSLNPGRRSHTNSATVATAPSKLTGSSNLLAQFTGSKTSLARNSSFGGASSKQMPDGVV